MLKEAAKTGLAGAGGAGGFAAATMGLDRAAQMAGDVLRGIFGGLPWEMAWSAIVDAVAKGGPATFVDVVGVVL